MRPFKQVESAVIESAAGAERTVSTVVIVSAAVMLLAVGIAVGALLARR